MFARMTPRAEIPSPFPQCLSLPPTCRRGVAQPGRVLRSGRRSRRFESSRPDQPLLLLFSSIHSARAGLRLANSRSPGLPHSFGRHAVPLASAMLEDSAGLCGNDEIPILGGAGACCLVGLAKGANGPRHRCTAIPGGRAHGGVCPLWRQSTGE